MLPQEFERNFSGEVPIFPLPNVVFFPGTKLPLHIFEPRYRQMVTDVHRGEQLISVVLLDRGAKPSAAAPGKPPVHAIGGLGKLTRIERLPRGLFNIDLFGLSRVKILEEVESDKPYRTARVQLVSDTSSPGVDSQSEELLKRAFEAFNKVIRKYSDFPGEFLTRFKGLPVGMLLDILAHHVPCESSVKQELLAETNPLKRCDHLVDVLNTIYEGATPSQRISVVSLFPSPSLN